MTLKPSKNKNSNIALTIALISLVTIALVLTRSFSQSDLKITTAEIVNQSLKQSSPSVGMTGINETNILTVANSYYNYSAAPLNTNSVSLNTVNSTVYNHPDMSGFFFLPPDTTVLGQLGGSDLNDNSYTPTTAVPISLDESEFITYTYGGYSVQQPDSSQFIFSFPDNISQGQVAGSDAVAWNLYAIQKIDFDAAFVAPKISALGFDEMAIFATSNTITYKGTEFGIRIDLKDGLIYGYVQEQSENFGDVNFLMQELMPNDGIMHHYTLILHGSGVSFLIDGLNYGNLNFPTNTDYSSFSFSICAVVHRFTDGWDSGGDSMITGNFTLNQQ
jgi:hypothetical protein